MVKKKEAAFGGDCFRNPGGAKSGWVGADSMKRRSWETKELRIYVELYFLTFKKITNRSVINYKKR